MRKMSDAQLRDALRGGGRRESKAELVRGVAAEDQDGNSVRVLLGGETVSADGRPGVSVRTSMTGISAGDAVDLMAIRPEGRCGEELVLTGCYQSEARKDEEAEEVAEQLGDAVEELAADTLDQLAEVERTALENVQRVAADMEDFRDNVADTYASWSELTDTDDEHTRSLFGRWTNSEDPNAVLTTKSQAKQTAREVSAGVRDEFADGLGLVYDQDAGWSVGSGTVQTYVAGAVSDAEGRVSDRIVSTETTLEGVETTITSTITDTVRLWYASSSQTSPPKPTTNVTASSSLRRGAWNRSVPSYSAYYPYYYTCLQFAHPGKTGVTYSWGDVVFDQALTDARGEISSVSTVANGAASVANGAASDVDNVKTYFLETTEGLQVGKRYSSSSSDYTGGYSLVSASGGFEVHNSSKSLRAQLKEGALKLWSTAGALMFSVSEYVMQLHDAYIGNSNQGYINFGFTSDAAAVMQLKRFADGRSGNAGLTLNSRDVRDWLMPVGTCIWCKGSASLPSWGTWAKRTVQLVNTGTGKSLTWTYDKNSSGSNLTILESNNTGSAYQWTFKTSSGDTLYCYERTS